MNSTEYKIKAETLPVMYLCEVQKDTTVRFRRAARSKPLLVPKRGGGRDGEGDNSKGGCMTPPRAVHRSARAASRCSCASIAR